MLNIFLCLCVSGYCVASGAESIYKTKVLTSGGLVEFQITEPSAFKSVKGGNELDSQKEFSQLKITRKEIRNNESLNIKRVAVIGDTGCRLKKSNKGERYQNCRDEKSWPFKKIMEDLVKLQPDLVVHLGDYHYRESCGTDKSCLEKSDSLGYGWEAWRDDFFKPAGPLLEKVPWVFVRGNHEDCHRAHLGFDLFLSGAYQPGGSLKEECQNRIPTQFIHLGDLLIINMDTSPVLDSPGLSEDLRAQINKDMDQLEAELKNKTIQNVWLVTHKPYAGFAPFAKTALPVNVNLRKVFEAHPSFKKIQLAIAGHIHLLEILKPHQGPLQIVVGNSGTDLDELKTIPDFKSLDFSFGLTTSKADDFGYAVLNRKEKSKGWDLEAFNLRGEVFANCELGPKNTNCRKN